MQVIKLNTPDPLIKGSGYLILLPALVFGHKSIMRNEEK